MAVAAIHEFVFTVRRKAGGLKQAACSCGWKSTAYTTNIRKAWRQHVTRGSK